MTTLLPTGQSSGTTYWVGENLYEYNLANKDWTVKYNLTPLHHWRLNDVGSITSDSGSNPISGYSTGALLSQTGKIDKCMYFNATQTTYVDVGTSSCQFTNQNFTFTFWEKPDAVSAQKLLFSNVVNNDNGYYISNGLSTGNVDFITFNGGAYQITSAGSLTAGVWQHVAVSRYNSTCTIYINGEDKRKTYGNHISIGVSVSPFKFGIYAGAAGFSYAGYLEDVRVYDRVLTQQEISAIYERGRGTYSQSLIKGYPTVKEPVFHYRLNELTGTVANNKGSISLSGPIDTGIQINQTGIIGKCMSFPQTSTSNIIVPNAGNFMSVTTQISMSTWVKWSGTNDNLGITALAAGGNNYGAFAFLKYLQKTAIFLGGGYSTLYYPMSTTSWCHYAFTADGTNAKLYVNGSFQTQTAYSSAFNFNNLNLEIGRGGYAAASYVWNGSIEDLRYYNYPLSETEIRNIYNNGKGTYL